MTVESAAEILLLADSHAYALLKEQAMNLIVDNYSKVKATSGWKQLRESSSLLTEVLDNMSGEAINKGDAGEKMGVSELRKRLASRGLDADGTREMLVKRLKTEQG